MGARFLLVILVLALLLPVVACEDNVDTTISGPNRVGQGGTIVVDLTVNLPSNLYFNGPKPVSIKPPGNVPFKFSQDEWAQKGKPTFPMQITFEVPRATPDGKYKVPFAMQLMYCNKTDDICLIKNNILPVDVTVDHNVSPLPNSFLKIEKSYEVKP